MPEIQGDIPRGRSPPWLWWGWLHEYLHLLKPTVHTQLIQLYLRKPIFKKLLCQNLPEKKEKSERRKHTGKRMARVEAAKAPKQEDR